MEDYAKAAASPGFITIGEVQYRVAKFGPRSLGDLQAWLKSQVPDPRLKAREICAGLSDAVALEVWREFSTEAMGWPPSIDTIEGNKLLTMTHEGAAQVAFALLRKHNPAVDMAKARELADSMDSAQINELIRLGFPEANFDPKGPTPETERGPVPV